MFSKNCEFKKKKEKVSFKLKKWFSPFNVHCRIYIFIFIQSNRFVCIRNDGNDVNT